MKDPKYVRDLAVSKHKLATLTNTDKEIDAGTVVDTLQAVGAFSNDASKAVQGLVVAGRMLTDFVDKSHGFTVARLQALLPKLALVNFACLTEEQQATLKGAEVGAALRDLRIKMVN